MQLVSEETIVISRRAYGEADLVVTLLTRSGSVVSGIAKNGLKSKRRFGAAFDLFVHGKTEWRTSRTSLVSFVESSAISAHPGIRTDVLATASASYGCELVTSLFREESGSPELFDHLLSFLRSLETPTTLAEKRVLVGLRLLSIAGYASDFMCCTSCGKTDLDFGGLNLSIEDMMVCAGCAGHDRHMISPPILASLAKLSNPKFLVYDNVKLSSETILAAERVISVTLAGLDVSLRSLAVLRSLSR